MTGASHASVAERLDRLSFPEPNSGCVLWLGCVDQQGYSRFKSPYGQTAHRASYALYVGPIAKGMDLDHLCRVRHCIAPWHLELVTRRTNLLRGKTIAARNATKALCLNGHPFDDENTYRDPRGGRGCRTCRRERSRRRNRQAS